MCKLESTIIVAAAKALLVDQNLCLEQCLVLAALLLEQWVQMKGEAGYNRYELYINQLNAKLNSP